MLNAEDRRRKSEGRRYKCSSLLVLMVLSLFIVIVRLQTYYEPFERDITSHAVIAHEMLGGRQLYCDLWDSKPPGIFVTYALADAIIGYGPGAVYFIGVVAAVITLSGAYSAGSAYGGTRGGVWVASFWAVICSDLWLCGLPPFFVPVVMRVYHTYSLCLEQGGA